MSKKSSTHSTGGTPVDRYMRAYYHTFEPTGYDPVDAVLEAIAIAGKGCHCTSGWDAAEQFGQDGYWTLIQQRANEAAAALSQWPVVDGVMVERGAKALRKRHLSAGRALPLAECREDTRVALTAALATQQPEKGETP